MLEPIYYDIGRICKEVYYKPECNKKNQNMTPKMIDDNILKDIKSPLLKIPFDCPEDIANYLMKINKEEVYGTIKVDDKEIKYYIVNFGKYIDNIDNKDIVNLNDLEPNLIVIADGRRLIKRKELLLIPKLREKISPNTAIYFPTALPWEIPLLVYLGVDYFDYSSASYYASLGYYFTKNRMICIKNKSFEELLQHNISILDEVVEEVKYCIKEGCLRNLVEETAISDPYLFGNYRRYNPDLRNIPLSKGKKIIVTINETTIPEVKKYIKQMKNYEAFTNTVVLLPCSSKKPYSHSKSHQYFINTINSVNFPVEEVILTSPYGVVPRALEGVVNYDIPVTGKWSSEEIEFINKHLKEYLSNAKDKFGELNIIAHLPEHYLEILDENEYKKYGSCIVTSKDGNPTSVESLENLKKTLKELKLKGEKEDNINISKTKKMQFIHNYKQLAKFQFNKDFIPEDVIIKGRHRKFFIKQNNKLVQICSLNEENGLLVLTYDGGNLLGKTKWVEVDFKVKKGSLFAPGFKDCDENISVNDEIVIIYDDKVVGVGRALMSGLEMKKAKHGSLANIRHVNYD
ncbi:archaeosine synthase subunit alpha [Methanothermococcus okinawensis]|uniref:PUA domain containing protein n=1 Tax=Methanothermococcus okinawensis (strain DSM 14208 / JCM 11175 / IH1) TaxID=647113 RepID=F8AMG1_METOI|nr:archaeosine synthase subunit alpha [Methanothermococcus okinawensis]AEH06001.1 PUA domain containing protein [Methanothermococcus okinawensis IH1]